MPRQNVSCERGFKKGIRGPTEAETIQGNVSNGRADVGPSVVRTKAGVQLRQLPQYLCMPVGLAYTLLFGLQALETLRASMFRNFRR